MKKVRFVYPRFQRHAEAHPELLEHVPCNEYFGPPSLGIACLAAVTPDDWTIEFRDDRVDDVGLDDCDDVTLVALSFFTAAAKRGMELADAFRARGKQVVAGGLFPTMMPDTVAPHVDAVVVGEAEGVWPEVLRDAAAGKLKPRYTESEQVDLSTLPLPRVDLYLDREGPRYHPDDYPVQTSRGCPLACYACALPTSMGKKLREYPLDHVLGQIDQLNRRGKLASFTEDTSFFVFGGVQRRFAELLDRIAAQGGPAKVSYIGISMPMILATPASVFAQMTRAGIKMFYLVGGFDPITQGAFTGDNPKAERRALDAIRKCHDLGIEPYTSFLVGNEDDNAGTFDRMLAFADAANIRKAEFAIMTPYPGTPVWHRLVGEGRILHRDWSRYNDANVVFRPKHLTPEQLQEGYLYLWREFYRPRQSLRHDDAFTRTIQF
jgi:radical SAM superfamily enzyme YgiQ (UPF0313 family)